MATRQRNVSAHAEYKRKQRANRPTQTWKALDPTRPQIKTWVKSSPVLLNSA